MKLRPLFVTGSLVHGGAERHSITVMNRLAERNHDCHAVYVKNDPSQLVRINQNTVGSVHCLHASRFLDRDAITRFAEHLDRLQPSVIVAANGYALMYASLARLQSHQRAPIMATFHTTQLSGLKEQVKMLIDRPFFWQAERTVFVCETQKRYWLKRAAGSRQNQVIYNGVDIEHFSDHSLPKERQTLRQRFGFAENDYVIGISAVLRPEKNHLQLINALAVLRSMGFPARVLIIGDGPLRDMIETRSQTLRVKDSVGITGFVEDVRPYLAICDVTVLCSTSVETFSLAALEAMAMGKPVIHSDVGGATEMIFPGHNGYLFAAGNTGELVHRLTILADREIARQMGQAGRALVEASFSESVMVDRYEQVLTDVAARRREIPQPPELHAVIAPSGTSGIQIKQGANNHENV